MDKQKLIQRLIEIKVVEKRRDALKNTDEPDFYINIKRAYGHPDILRKIIHLMYKKIDRMVNVVAAQGYGGVPLASKLSTDYNLNLTMIKEDKKTHSLENKIEGYIPNKEDKVFIVDDVFTTGNSIQDIIDALKPTGAAIIGYGVVVKRGEGKLSPQLRYILTAEDLLKSR